jgi:hypothetical protein
MPSKRDVTVALNTVKAARATVDGDKIHWRLTQRQRDRLLRILIDIDARTGKRDPHLRRKR